MSFKNRLASILKAKPYNINDLLVRAEQIRAMHTHIALCPSPTGSNWLGINNATQRLFPDSFLEIPQEYSNQVLSETDLGLLLEKLNQLQFSNIILSGYPLYFQKIVRGCINSSAQKISVIIHGTFSEMGHGTHAAEPMRNILELLANNSLHKVGVVRKDVTDFIQHNWNYRAFTLLHKCEVSENTRARELPKRALKIGIFGSGNFNKNIHNQVCGALLIKDALIYVGHKDSFNYLGTSRIESIGNKSKEEFLNVLADMDINLHLSFSESWGQIATESLAMGVPCLVSPATNILDADPWLREVLTVNKIDAPLAIAEAIQNTMQHYTGISEKGIDCIRALNREADISMQKFLEA